MVGRAHRLGLPERWFPMTTSTSQDMTWFLKAPQGEMVYGPYSTVDLQQLLQLGRLNPQFLVSQDQSQWYYLEQVLKSSASTQPTHRKEGEAAAASSEPVTRREETAPSGQFGHYALVQELGRGGSGVVYKALDTRVQRLCALKILLSGGQDQREILRFLREIRVTAQLDHPNIVRVFDMGDAPQPFFTMEYIQGKTLSQLLREGLLTLGQKLKLFVTICAAIEYAHRQRVIHRDIKPSNILVDKQGIPKITDFGLARKLDRTHGQITLSNEILGTPQYMAPEQAAGKETDQRTDIYSLGSLLYELLTGRPPFEGETVLQIFSQLSNCEPVSPRTLNPDIARDMELICLRCLQKLPKRRYLTVGLLRRDVERFLENRPISLRPPGIVERAVGWGRRHKIATAIGIANVFALVASIVALVFFAMLQRQMVTAAYLQGCDYFYPKIVTKDAATKIMTKEASTPDFIQAQLAFTSSIDRNRIRDRLSPGLREFNDYWLRGCSYFISQDYPKANADLEQTYAIVKRQLPQSFFEQTQLLLLLSLCAAEQGKIEEAKAWWDKAQKAWAGLSTGFSTDWRHCYQNMAVRNHSPLPIYFRMPLPDEECTMYRARCHLVLPFLPQEMLERVQRLLVISQERFVTMQIFTCLPPEVVAEVYPVLLRQPQEFQKKLFTLLLSPDWGQEACQFLKEKVPDFGRRFQEMYFSSRGRNPETERRRLNQEYRYNVLQEQIYKIYYLLFERAEPWIDYARRDAATRFSELKELLFYTVPSGTGKSGTWICDMASPYWVYLPWERQESYARLYQDVYAKQLGMAKFKTFSCRQAEFEMALIPPGQSLMGTAYAEAGRENPQHFLVLTRPFWLSKTEVTQKQWCQVRGISDLYAGTRPDALAHIAQGNNMPVVFFNLEQDFPDFFEKLPGPSRLPDETHWEYACRAGFSSAWILQIGEEKAKDYLWFEKNAWLPGEMRIRPVAQKLPSAWGLYDMHGNAGEWCRNPLFPYTAERLVDTDLSTVRPTNPEKNSLMVRGGHIESALTQCRAADRIEFPARRHVFISFRFMQECH